eukprot:scaffold1.g5414.t1
MAPSLSFQLTPTTQLVLTLGDITQFHGDAIVNTGARMLCSWALYRALWICWARGLGSQTNEQLVGKYGVDGAIHKAVGKELQTECNKVKEVRKGVRCPTVGPHYAVGGDGDKGWGRLKTKAKAATSVAETERLLGSAYRSCLRLANEHGLKTIAFPAISCGRAAHLCRGGRAAGGDSLVLWTQELLDVWAEAAEALFGGEGSSEEEEEEEEEWSGEEELAQPLAKRTAPTGNKTAGPAAKKPRATKGAE